jgi:very-short-patch-repair endonuclease
MKPRPLPTAFQSTSFSVQDALEMEVSEKRLRASDLVSPFHGIRALTPPVTIVERCRAYAPWLAELDFFSHSTAALLYGVPLPSRLESSPLLHVTGVEVRPRGRGIRGHRAAATATRTFDGLPVTDPTYLLVELASQLNYTELVIAADGLVRRVHPVTTLEELRDRAGSRTARNVRSARAALDQARSGTDSAMETRLRLVLVQAGLPEPVIHHRIYDAAGRFVGTPDLSYVKERVAIEYEGEHHRNDPKVFAYDIERRERMQEADWYVIRVISDHVYRYPSEWAARIRRVRLQRS